MVFVGVKKSGEMMKTKKKRENTRTFFSVQFYYY